MIESALRYPWDDGDGLVPLLIGSGLLLISFLLVPIVLIFGYYVKVLRSVANEDTHVPEWDDWNEILWDGLRATGVTLCYQLLSIVALIGVWVAIVLGVEVIGDGLLLIPVFFVLFLIAILSLVLWYVLPVALTHMAVKQEFSAAFDVSVVKSVGFTREYFVVWGLVVLVSLAASVLSTMLTLTGVGSVLSVGVSFYTTVMAGYLYAVGYRQVM